MLIDKEIRSEELKVGAETKQYAIMILDISSQMVRSACHPGVLQD